MNAHSYDWDNLRLVLAIARGGGLSGAAKEMRLHHATVLRRLDAFERQIGVRLFERMPRGYAPTSDGDELAAIAARVEDDVLGAYRRVAGKDLRLSGTIRCATADYVVQLVFPPILSKFRAAYPEIELEIAISPQLASLTKRDADVAVRPTNEPPEGLVGSRVAGLRFAPFGSRTYLAAHDSGDPEWIGPDETLSHGATTRWRERFFPSAKVTTRMNSLIGILEAARAGLGIALLPVAMAEADPSLVRFSGKYECLELGIWLLTHPDLQRSQRVRAFMQLASEEIRAMAPRLEQSG